MSKSSPAPDAEIGPDTPLRLADALRIAFPAGGIGPSGLRSEAAKGNLRLIRIANRDFTTLKAIEEMLEKCKVPLKAHGPTSSDLKGRPSETSTTGEPGAAWLALQTKIDELKNYRRRETPAKTTPRSPRKAAHAK